MKKKCLFILLIFVNGIFAQIDTLECLRYLPLDTGNRWYYLRADLNTGGWDTSYVVKKVIGDTTMINGKRYRNLQPSGPYMRIDTSALLVYQFGDMSWAGCSDSESVLFDLSLLISGIDTFIRCDDIMVQMDRYNGNAGFIAGNFENIRYSWFSVVGEGYTLSKGVGISSFGMEEIFVHSDKLLGAEINGVKYGTFAAIDTQKCLSFLPLQIGNQWEYEGISFPPFIAESDTEYIFEQVTGIVTKENKKRYYKIAGQYDRYLRIDTTRLLVYQYGYFGCQDSESVLFDLSLVFSEQDSFIRCDSIVVFTETYEGNAGKIRGDYLNISYGWFDGVSIGYTLSQGLGISYYTFFEIGGGEKNLIGAVIEGQKYGSFAARDTLEFLSYYPLHIGDRWQYKYSIYYSASEYQIWYSTTEIIGDTVLPNGKRYFQFSNPGLEYSQFERIDTTNLCVFEYFPNACSNDEKEKLYLFYSPDSSRSLYNCFEEYFIISKTDSIHLSIDYSYLTSKYYNLLRRVGIVSFGEQEGGPGVNAMLIAANINGVQYGKFLGIDESSDLPGEFRLYSNYPNPFNPATHIRFTVPKSGYVELAIYNLRGEWVRTLIAENLQAGEYGKIWDGKNEFGIDLASGIYFSVLKFEGQTSRRNKMLKLK